MDNGVLLNIEKNFADMLPKGWVGKYVAFMGNANGTVKANNYNDVYVIKHDRSVEIVRNMRVPNQAKLAVIVGHDDQNPTLLQVLREVNAYQKPPYSPIAEHADPNHTRWGRDPVFISKEQITDLLPYPESFTGLTVQLRGGKYYLNGDHILDNQIVDFSTEIPTSGACWVLAEVDEAKVITLRAGSTLASREVLSPEDIPAPATDKKRLFAVKCYYGQTRIVQNKTMQDIYILHDVPGEGGKGSAIAHNDLSGLQGGTSGQYYHLTAAQLAVLSVPITAANGGTGVDNGSATLTLPNMAITLGGGGASQTYTLPSVGGQFALLNAANVFTTIQTITPATDVVGLIINKSATANAFQIKNGATVLAAFNSAGRLIADGGLGGGNIFIGANSGLNAIVGMTNNVAIGVGALHSANNAAADSNFALGTLALTSLTSGSQNVAIGQSAGQSVTTAIQSVMIGDYAGTNLAAARDIAIGSSCAQPYATGGDNVWIGANIGISAAVGTAIASSVWIGSAIAPTATGSKNVLIGRNCGFSLTSGASNIFIGYRSGYNQSTLSNLLIFDNQLRASAAAEITDSIIYGVMASTPAAQTLRLNAVTSIVQVTAATATIVNAGIIQGESTGTPAANFGVAQLFVLETATTGTNKNAGRLWNKWVVPTNGSETSAVGLSAFTNSTEQEFISGQGDAGGVKLALYGGTRVARGAALTTQLTTITHTAPGTPDYAIADTTNIAPYGFTTQDEANTVLSVISNLQVRVQQLEDRLSSVAGINAFA